MSPYFSIVIPMFNREREIERALHSVLAQDFPDFEVLVVDDGSTDNSARVVEHVTDPRVQLLTHPSNRGLCPARSTGTRRARGSWVVFLDSDDELLPGALRVLLCRTQEAPGKVHRIGCTYQRDDGGFSPDPRPEGQVLDYEGYIRWIGDVRLSDCSLCTRRSTFEEVPLPDGRDYDTKYHLDFAQRFHTWLLPDVVAMVHLKAANRIPNLSVVDRMQLLLLEAADRQRSMESLLEAHGDALSQHAPQLRRLYQRMMILFALMAGHRLQGGRYALSFLRQHGVDLHVSGALLVGLLGARLLAWLQGLRCR